MNINLNPGDHLVSTRAMGLYEHHGIYVGSSRVIHYAGMASGISKGKVEITELQDFVDGSDLKILRTKAAFSNAKIVDRAFSKLGEDEYNILTNNCEHFANWCRTGVSESAQVQSVTTVSSIALAAYMNWPKTVPTVMTAVLPNSAALNGTATQIAGVVSRSVGMGAFSQTALPTAAKAAVSLAPSLSATTAGIAAGSATGLVTATSTVASVAAATASAPIVVPVVAAVAVGAAVTGILDWIFD